MKFDYLIDNETLVCWARIAGTKRQLVDLIRDLNVISHAKNLMRCFVGDFSRDDEFLITYNVVMMRYNFVKFNILFHRIGFDQGLFYITALLL